MKCIDSEAFMLCGMHCNEFSYSWEHSFRLCVHDCLFVIREQIIKQSTELICRAYGEVYAAVLNPINEYKDPETILHRSPQQVQTLLS